jgi:hypothetical protein
MGDHLSLKSPGKLKIPLSLDDVLQESELIV